MCRSLFRFFATRLRRLRHFGVLVPAAAPRVVCLCGSTRFGEAFREANLQETLAGHIVLTVGCDTKSDDELFAGLTATQRSFVKRGLDQLHFRKIDLADEILVLNVNHHIGESTRKEILYAQHHNKRVRWWVDLDESFGSGTKRSS